MAQLLFPGDIDFTISQIDKDGMVTFCMFNHTDDATSIYANVPLDREELISLKEWIEKELGKIKGKTPS